MSLKLRLIQFGNQITSSNNFFIFIKIQFCRITNFLYRNISVFTKIRYENLMYRNFDLRLSRMNTPTSLATINIEGIKIMDGRASYALFQWLCCNCTFNPIPVNERNKFVVIREFNSPEFSQQPVNLLGASLCAGQYWIP